MLSTDFSLDPVVANAHVIRALALSIVRSGVATTPLLGDVFTHLGHDVMVLDAVRVLVLLEVPAAAVAASVASPRFTEETFYRLLARATTLDLIAPLFIMKGNSNA